MKKTEQQQPVIGDSCRKESPRKLSDRIVKVQDGLYVLKPREGVTPRFKHRLTCKTSGKEFIVVTDSSRSPDWMQVDPEVFLASRQLPAEITQALELFK